MDGFQQDISHLLCTDAFFSVVAHSLYQPDEAKLRAVAGLYATGGNHRMAGYLMDGKLVGCAGVDLSEPDRAVLHHLAVGPAHRGFGIGRKMIEGLMAMFSIQCLEAETDGDAVGFYRRCGFAVTNLGEKYPGVARYSCIKHGLKRMTDRMDQ